jgi:hypothetical protein
MTADREARLPWKPRREEGLMMLPYFDVAPYLLQGACVHMPQRPGSDTPGDATVGYCLSWVSPFPNNVR